MSRALKPPAIVVTGANENNLRSVSVSIPHGKITAFAGVSGSGKSSLVFGTIAAEAQRQLNETFSFFARNRLPQYARPKFEHVDGLTTPVVIDQRGLFGNARSTVATITDIAPLMRLLFSRLGKPGVASSDALSFNEPEGMCPSCQGLGRRTIVNVDAFLDRTKSINQGCFAHPDFQVGRWSWKIYALSGRFDNDKPLARYSKKELSDLLYGSGGKVPLPSKGGPVHSDYEGVVPRFERLFVHKDREAMPPKKREAIERLVHEGGCSDCGGTRLNARARACTIDGRNIAEWAAMEASSLLEVVRAIEAREPRSALEGLALRLQTMVDVGAGYVRLDRETASLSGGEAQRIKYVKHLTSALVGMTYILDEPSAGLHAADMSRLLSLIQRLRDRGNTVLVVEHELEVIRAADYVIELGPGAGHEGGSIVFDGSPGDLPRASTATAEALGEVRQPKARVRTPVGHVVIREARENNLKSLSFELPIGVLVVLSGVAGSGKSSLSREIARQHAGAVVVEQRDLATSIRSTPTTFTGLMDLLRERFAKASGESASLFSFNGAGACPTCSGTGVVHIDLAFIEGVTLPCSTCSGTRYRTEVLQHAVRGATIADILAMTVDEALAWSTSDETLAAPLRGLRDAGLGYLLLGQSLRSLSGGERQRLKLATELQSPASFYILDEPTRGLHSRDVNGLLTLMDRLVDRGSTVVAIEHNLDVIKSADWIFDLGPSGGAAGGQLLFQGTPAELAHRTDLATGHALHATLATASKPRTKRSRT